MAVFAALLLLTLLVGLWRVLLGPGRVDRLLAVQLFGEPFQVSLLVIGRKKHQYPGRTHVHVSSLMYDTLKNTVQTAKGEAV